MDWSLLPDSVKVREEDFIWVDALQKKFREILSLQDLEKLRNLKLPDEEENALAATNIRLASASSGI